jgi:uncharacterized protein (UPF0333 family)
MKKTSQNGIAHLGLLLLVLIVVVIGFVGYKVVQNRENTTTASTASSAATPQAIPTISSKADLNTAETTLNSQNVDGDLNPDSYNSDVSSLQ